MLGWGKKARGPKDPQLGRPGETIKFDPAKVTENVKADLRQNIKVLKEVGPADFDIIYDAALRSLGGALDILCQSLRMIDGLSKRRAEDITHSLWFKANALLVAERHEQLGIKYAIWRYSGAPCGDQDQDAVHKAVDGKPYLVSKGMLVNGKWTRPGREDCCKCWSSPLIAGFGYDGRVPEGFVE